MNSWGSDRRIVRGTPSLIGSDVGILRNRIGKFCQSSQEKTFPQKTNQFEITAKWFSLNTNKTTEFLVHFFVFKHIHNTLLESETKQNVQVKWN